eukprot:m.114184 g.114184  ORF g.114184 m.114184 type:complete len:313 (-) comp16022_c0_seq9:69-1007(-)
MSTHTHSHTFTCTHSHAYALSAFESLFLLFHVGRCVVLKNYCGNRRQRSILILMVIDAAVCIVGEWCCRVDGGEWWWVMGGSGGGGDGCCWFCRVCIVAAAAAAAAAAAPAAPQINEEMVQQLVSMGFSYEGCRKAVYHNPTNVEAAMEWVMTHMGDPDFDTPLVLPSAAGASATGAAAQTEFSEESLSMIESMGFTRKQARKALQATSGNVERAADWIFNHMDELDTMDVDTGAGNAPAAAAAAAKSELPSCSGRYRLKAFVSHIGPSTTSGHYVCHINKDGRWVLFNDSKVAFSEDVPVDMGYLYLYEAI